MRNIAIGEWGAYIVLMYDKNSSWETKRGETDTSGTQYTIAVHSICSQWDGMFIVHDNCNKGGSPYLFRLQLSLLGSYFGGNLWSKQEREAALFLTVIVSMAIVYFLSR